MSAAGVSDAGGSLLCRQARALGDPTRYRIFDHVRAADHPVGVAELTDHTGLNHNAVRQHLAKLCGAGLLVERTAPVKGPGRPRLEYVLDPAAEGRWGSTGPYQRLSLLLSEVISSGDPPVVVGERAGRRSVAGSDTEVDPLDAVVEEMTRQGFDPVVERGEGVAEVVLRSCPFEEVARADPSTVCELHLGTARGLVAEVGGLSVDSLSPEDPRQAGCRLEITLEAGGS